MSDISFTACLARELTAAQCALLAVIEKHDRMLFVEGPLINAEYMAKVGVFEEDVLRAEMEAYSLRRKSELIQAALNRREPLDLEAIDRQVAEECKMKLGELQNGMAAENSGSYSQTSDEMKELQDLYRDIVQKFHPGVNKDITETQRNLYEKAVEAYRRQNLDGLRVIHDMLFGTGCDSLVLEFEFSFDNDDNDEVEKLVQSLREDYSLASELYDCFDRPESDILLRDAINACRYKANSTIEKIANMLGEYPFTAQDMLRSEDKTNEYLEDLKMRKRQAEIEKHELEQRISQMTGAAAHE